MKRTTQTRLSDFIEPAEDTPAEPSLHSVKATNTPVQITESTRKHQKLPLWNKTMNRDEDWGVCDLNDTVLLIRLIDGRIHAHGQEAVCKWCGGFLEIRDEKIFCAGQCRRYQGEFSKDLNAFLIWEGVKSYTIRKIVAEIEHLELESRDLEPIDYVPDWSVLYEYEEDSDEESESVVISKE